MRKWTYLAVIDEFFDVVVDAVGVEWVLGGDGKHRFLEICWSFKGV
jgi:hypothetical protein